MPKKKTRPPLDKEKTALEILYGSKLTTGVRHYAMQRKKN